MDYQSLSKTLQNNVSNDIRVTSEYGKVLRALKSNTATYKEVERFANVLGRVISVKVESVLPNIQDTEIGLFAKHTLKPLYKNSQKTVLNVATQTQKSINKRNGIGVKCASVVSDQSRVDHIVTRFFEAEKLEDVRFLTEKNVLQNMMRGAVIDTIKANAEALERAGAQTIMSRYSSSGCCEWCDSVSGSYERGTEPDGFWNVHTDCNCTIEYKCTFTGTYDKVTFETHKNSKGKKILYKNEQSI